MNEFKEINKNKIFVRNINVLDIPYFTKEFNHNCNKYFFFGKDKIRNAICHFKKEEEAKEFLIKYNNKKICNSFIKCTYALKKKCEERKILPILYNNKKIIYNNSIQIITDYIITIKDLFNFLENIFLKNKNYILDNFDIKQKNINKNENDGFEIVLEKQDKSIENLILTIKKNSLKNDKNKLEKNIYKSKKIKKYIIEFINKDLANLFTKLINKKEFDEYIKQANEQQEIKLGFIFSVNLYTDVNKNKKIVIKNLNSKCNKEHIQNFFKNIDQNIQIYIPKKKKFAFVLFSTVKNAEKALSLNESKLCGNIITIEKIKDKLNSLDISNENIDKNIIQNDTLLNNNKLENKEIKELKNKKRNRENNNENKNKIKKNKNDINENNINQNDIDQNNFKKIKKNENDVDEGKTLFITNIPIDTTDEEFRNYVKSKINEKYIYININKKNPNKLSAFVKLSKKSDADDFLKKIGEFEEESDNEENVIEKFYKKKKKKKK